jgi:hypothetical protein
MVYNDTGNVPSILQNIFSQWPHNALICRIRIRPDQELIGLLNPDP